jgi:hypothetical protein
MIKNKKLKIVATPRWRGPTLRKGQFKYVARY